MSFEQRGKHGMHHSEQLANIVLILKIYATSE